MAPPDSLIALSTCCDTTPPAPLLRLDGLSVFYGPQRVVSNVWFSLVRGKSLALIGESGSGKSTIVRAVLRLLPDGARTTSRVTFNACEVLGLSERRFRKLRGRAMGFVPQDPANAHNPVRTIGAQAMEAAALFDKAGRKTRILDMFAQVGLDNPSRVYESYPHQLSGGMLQRVLIGLAVLPRPALLVADEPTSALDVTIQKQILDLLSRLQQERDISLLLITHDLAIAAERADSLAGESGGFNEVALHRAERFVSRDLTEASRFPCDCPGSPR